MSSIYEAVTDYIEADRQIDSSPKNSPAFLQGWKKIALIKKNHPRLGERIQKIVRMAFSGKLIPSRLPLEESEILRALVDNDVLELDTPN